MYGGGIESALRQPLRKEGRAHIDGNRAGLAGVHTKSGNTAPRSTRYSINNVRDIIYMMEHSTSCILLIEYNVIVIVYT